MVSDRYKKFKKGCTLETIKTSRPSWRRAGRNARLGPAFTPPIWAGQAKLMAT